MISSRKIFLGTICDNERYYIPHVYLFVIIHCKTDLNGQKNMQVIVFENYIELLTYGYLNNSINQSVCHTLT